MIVNGPMDGRTFMAYTESCLARALLPGDVVVMDNLSSDKSAAVVQAIEAAGPSVWFLPPYRPDLNPIEKLWSKVKSWLRKTRPPNFDAIGDELARVLRTVTPAECGNYFASCGYGK